MVKLNYRGAGLGITLGSLEKSALKVQVMDLTLSIDGVF